MKRTFNAYSTKGKWTFTVYTIQHSSARIHMITAL